MIGQPVPHFYTIDSEGQPISSTSLLEHCYVLYFYPKDDTPGCTTEACNFLAIQTQNNTSKARGF